MRLAVHGLSWKWNCGKTIAFRWTSAESGLLRCLHATSWHIFWRPKASSVAKLELSPRPVQFYVLCCRRGRAALSHEGQQCLGDIKGVFTRKDKKLWLDDCMYRRAPQSWWISTFVLPRFTTLLNHTADYPYTCTCGLSPIRGMKPRKWQQLKAVWLKWATLGAQGGSFGELALSLTTAWFVGDVCWEILWGLSQEPCHVDQNFQVQSA